jgi:salicylate hydroxylase
VIGAGIGGLSAALSLLRAGFDVHVYEQAPTLGEVGAGVQVSPNASRVLHRVGLADRLAATGVRPLAWHQRRWDDGRTLLRSPLAGPLEAAFGFPHYQMHRADLLDALADAVPADRIHPGHRLTGYTDHGDRVEARFANGTTVHVDVLVGADGIHSGVRTELFGPGGAGLAGPAGLASSLLGPGGARFTGCIAYRGLVPADRVQSLGLEVTAQIWLGPGAHFVHYFVRARKLLNFVAIVERETWNRESWTDHGDIADALAAFDGWHPHVETILRSVDHTYVWALFDRPPLPRWSAGRVTLLGDACHPMLPFMAQGAAQAIEDGATLAACLAAEPGATDIPAALRRYEQVRIPRTARLQAISAHNKTRFHLPDGPQQMARDAEMAGGATDFSARAVAWIYAHDAGDLAAAADLNRGRPR